MTSSGCSCRHIGSGTGCGTSESAPLWLSEAAHVPVVWATQVLESLARTGIASRPELTDAAMSVRADCVMLNKGPYIGQALHTLGDILSRMEAHQRKKSARLQALHW